ncbi:hypothetical protein BegalDRAFT_0470 [Beggiatoa alba B18LD]|uniref:Peptidase S24/S26A/S26B/S26C domain-containing protein n=1 Tax=Beggiatoa alba B18LD TaxID=395493 RepID=I3CCP6_9GAMM|nr:S24 family peptidase [Beggiatoa alba]EIJ41389.1 hypothetical protein BegalDRAFT_0470 [Beggiatoa alba B18LD]
MSEPSTFFWLTMTSGSMMPLMPPQAKIGVHVIAKTALQMGDIAVFIAENKLIAHRVLRIETDGFWQCGDTNLSASKILYAQLIGKVEQIQTVKNTRFLKKSVYLQRSIARCNHFIVRLYPRYPRFSLFLHHLKYYVLKGLFH